MTIESLLDDIHKGLLVNPDLKILAKALEAERDAHLSTKNILNLAIAGQKKNFSLEHLASY